ncbi:MAG: redoxin domain-containing protein [Spirochaetota bacterium]
MHRTASTPARATALAVTILALLAVSPVSAGGRGESSTPSAEEAPAVTASQEAAPVDDGASAPGDPAATIPMDDATAATVAAMGMMPFEEKIPSEDFSLDLLAGGETSLSDHRGKVVFLNFWATWCPPCREEMPSMQTLYDELADEGLEMLAVNVLEDAETARGFIEEQGFTYPVPLDTNGRVMIRYGVRAYPTTYIIDREGNVLGVRPGFHDWGTDAMVASVRQLLESE